MNMSVTILSDSCEQAPLAFQGFSTERATLPMANTPALVSGLTSAASSRSSANRFLTFWAVSD